MSSPPPTKPPRGVKQGKETSGLLMSVIRTLSASETNEQREKERAKLEKEYKKSDARLDELVAAHAQEIMEVMQKFSAVNASLSSWGQHCEATQARLAACRGLLRLRRDDLRRLWHGARTHHHALVMLTDIERVVVSEREAREQIAAGRVLAGACTLTAALRAARSSLAGVDALTATRRHLEARKSALVELIVQRISAAVYRTERARAQSARRRTALLLQELTKSEEVTDAYLQEVTPEFEAALGEDERTFETTVMICLEALGVLEQLPQATEKFKCQIQNELLEVIDTVSRRVIEEGDVEPEAESEEEEDMPEDEELTETGRPLARLFSILADEFRAIAARNKRLLQLWRAALQKHKLPASRLHAERDYWSSVQQVLQLLVSEYLQIEPVSLEAARAPAAEPEPLRLADYFAKKRPQRRRPDLFKLSGDALARAAPAARLRPAPAVCRPAPALLHAVLPALHSLAADITPHTPGEECSLRVFLTNYVCSGERARLARLAGAAVAGAMAAPAAWRERAGAPGAAADPSGGVVFACCAGAWQGVASAVRAARACGRCGGGEALRAASSGLAALASHCRAAQARLAAPGSRAQRWLADDDIVRFLQALPNWAAATGTARPDPLELQQAYVREAEILGSSLGDGAVARREIIADPAALADIALFSHSMEWLSRSVSQLPAQFGAGGPRAPDHFVRDCAAHARAFTDISHKCLLLLHLELRIQCFHYLGQEEEEEEESEAGGGAGRLAAALLAFHEHGAVLPAPHLAYIMEGLGEMMSAAVVWRWRGGAGAGGGARLATLQHALAALQLPPAGLARAHTYLQLLACEPEEIVAGVREKGPQFSELEYLSALKVAGARRGRDPQDVTLLLRQLSAALGHVGVTV